MLICKAVNERKVRMAAIAFGLLALVSVAGLATGYVADAKAPAVALIALHATAMSLLAWAGLALDRKEMA